MSDMDSIIERTKKMIIDVKKYMTDLKLSYRSKKRLLNESTTVVYSVKNQAVMYDDQYPDRESWRILLSENVEMSPSEWATSRLSETKEWGHLEAHVTFFARCWFGTYKRPPTREEYVPVLEALFNGTHQLHFLSNINAIQELYELFTKFTVKEEARSLKTNTQKETVDKIKRDQELSNQVEKTLIRHQAKIIAKKAIEEDEKRRHKKDEDSTKNRKSKGANEKTKTKTQKSK